MSPKPADPRTRTALIEAAARLVVHEGPGALTTRRLAAVVGTSTMAVYTHFKGMQDVKAAVRKEGFDRLAGYLDAVPRTEDTVTDVAALGVAYFVNALSNAELYRFMFLEPTTEDEGEVGVETFEVLVDAVAAAVEAGRFRGEPLDLATQLWVTAHGIVTLQHAGKLTMEEAIACFAEMGTNLFVGFGDERVAAERSVEVVTSRHFIGSPS